MPFELRLEFDGFESEENRFDSDGSCDDSEKLERSRFIADGKSVAARYLTVDFFYLYARAVNDHFKLPFGIVSEKDGTELEFISMLKYLVEDDPIYALEIWEWCLDTFMPFIKYAAYKEEKVVKVQKMILPPRKQMEVVCYN